MIPAYLIPFACATVLLLPSAVFAAAGEHDHHQNADTEPPPGAPAEGNSVETSETPIAGTAMTREGSGTSWLPEDSPMWAFHDMSGDWMVMHHGQLMAMYTHQSGPRGDNRFTASDWYMLMAKNSDDQGEWRLRAMVSLEPLTIGDRGIPELFQTGEGMLDAQHAHDLGMELSAQYTARLGDDWAGYFYAAPIGEPPLGPTAFMHRPGAAENPSVPLTHHLVDSTHISYGVLTVGAQSEEWKFEVGAFNGHEPDDSRWAPDALRLNSLAGRISYAPNPNWTLQVSRGHIDRPEIHYEEHPHDVTRTTLSALYGEQWADGWASGALVWGHNTMEGDDGSGLLLEGTYAWDRHYVFGRWEHVTKNEFFPHDDPRAAEAFGVDALSLGYSYDVKRDTDMEVSLGAMGTLNFPDSTLADEYGDTPWGFQFFVRIRPGRMDRGASMDHAGHTREPAVSDHAGHTAEPAESGHEGHQH